MDGTVLSYHDSLLRESDVALLDSPNWLNDKIIGFYFEYLEYEMFKDFAGQVCFITPDVTQFIKLYKGPELGIFLDPLGLHEKQLVVLAVNNNPSVESPGGSHWSTLIFDRKDNTFQHLDSWSPTNSDPAKQCAQRIAPFLKAAKVSSLLVHEVDCPHQENSHDCGVYALCFAEAVSRMKLLGEPETLLKSIDGAAVNKWRTDTWSLINRLAKKGMESV